MSLTFVILSISSSYWHGLCPPSTFYCNSTILQATAYRYLLAILQFYRLPPTQTLCFFFPNPMVESERVHAIPATVMYTKSAPCFMDHLSSWSTVTIRCASSLASLDIRENKLWKSLVQMLILKKNSVFWKWNQLSQICFFNSVYVFQTFQT
jgi:hypothetical protein